MASIEELKAEIIEDLTLTMQSDDSFNADVLATKVKGAIRDVKMRRNYQATSFDDKEIAEDLYKYYNTITRLAEYDYNQLGAEGQSSHGENDTTRGWVSRDSILNGVHAFVDFVL